MIVANSPGQGKNNHTGLVMSVPYKKIMMKAKFVGLEPYSIAIETPVPIKMESATLISEKLTFHQVKDCICAGVNTILYFNDNTIVDIGFDYTELDRCTRSEDPEIAIYVICWVKENELCRIEPPSWHCRYTIDSQREFYIDNTIYIDNTKSNGPL